MSLAEGLGFSTRDVQRRSAAPAARELRRLIGGFAASADPYRELETSYLRDILNIDDDKRAARGVASAEVAQRFGGSPTGRTSALDSALRRARGLTRVQMAGDQKLEGQALRDRIGANKLALQRRGQGFQGLGSLAGVQAGVAGARTQADALVDSARSNLYGSILGAGARAAGPAYGAYQDWRAPDWADVTDLGNFGYGRTISVGR